jgi:hypothetical protein
VFSSLATTFKDGLPLHYNLVATITEHVEQLLREFNRQCGEQFPKAFHLSILLQYTIKIVTEFIDIKCKDPKGTPRS